LRNLGKSKQSKLKEIFITYLSNNKREYAIALLLFVIGLIFGIIFINNANSTQTEEIKTYLSDFVNLLKDNSQIDKGTLLKNELITNLLFVLALWFVGSTVVGIPIVYGIVMYRGFCLGYTLSAILATFGTGKRNIVYSIIIATTKYYLYSVHINTCSKWNETI
jgi:stage II sporulation protein M